MRRSDVGLNVHDHCAPYTCCGQRLPRRSSSAPSCIAGFTVGFSKAQKAGSDHVKFGDERKSGVACSRRLASCDASWCSRKCGCSSATRRSGRGYLLACWCWCTFQHQVPPLRGEGMTFFLQNVVPFLNLGLAGLCWRQSRRVHFPASLRPHVLAAALEPDVHARAIVVEFWVGTLPLLVLPSPSSASPTCCFSHAVRDDCLNRHHRS